MRTKRPDTLADLIGALLDFYSREYGDAELAQVATAATLNDALARHAEDPPAAPPAAA